MKTWRGGTLALILATALVVRGVSAGEHGSHEAPSHAEAPSHEASTSQSGQPAASAAPPVKGMAEVEVAGERRQMIGVRTEPISVRTLSQSIRTVGLVAPDERRVRKIQTRISGWVEKLLVSFTGAAVAAGDPILSIYSPDLVAAQREYLLALGAARAQRNPGEAPPGTESRLLLESSRTRLQYWGLGAAQIEQVERSGVPERTVVLHSPIGGVVTLKPVYQGMYVTPEMELYTVTDLTSVWIWADVYEDEIELVRMGQSARITLPSAPGLSRVAQVSYVNPTLEPSTRTLRIRFDADNQDQRVKPGMYATVEIEAPIGDALALPEEAVIATGERKVVFVAVEDGRYRPREVELGRKAGRYYEVLGGLAPGENVVVSAQFLLDSESRLRGAAKGGPAHGGH